MSRTWFVAALLVVPVALAGCSSSSGGKGKTGSTSAAPPAASSSAGFPASTPPATSSGSETATQAELDASLLTPADVGPGFTKAQFSPSGDPLPCTPNDPPLEQQFSSTLTGGTALADNPKAVAMSEDLRLYADPDTAEKVLQAAAKGLNCKQGKLNLTGTPEDVTFSAEQDATADTHSDDAISVQATSAQYDIQLIGCKIGRLVVLFSFLGAKGADTSTLSNPITIAAKGIDKIKNS